MKSLVVILCVFCVLSCNSHEEVWQDADAHVLESSKGILNVDGNTYTGVVYQLYPNGDTEYVKTYASGKLNGATRIWYPSGKLKAKYQYQDNVFHGSAEEWFPCGKLYRSFNYVGGQEVGKQTMYWDNGELRANYQSKNGRKYGLTGIKNCTSPWSDSLKHLLVTGM